VRHVVPNSRRLNGSSPSSPYCMLALRETVENVTCLSRVPRALPGHVLSEALENLSRNLDQEWESRPPGAQACRRRFSERDLIVGWLTAMANLSSSPWMRGARHNGLAEFMRRMRSRISAAVSGRPAQRDRQSVRMPLRWYRIIVASLASIEVVKV
jgi:hypothetical protein